AKASLEAPLRAPLPRLIVPPSPTRLTFFVPPLEVNPPKLMLTDGFETPVRSRPAPVVLIETVLLMLRAPTFAPTIALPLVLPMVNPWRVLAEASVTASPLLLAMVGVVLAGNRLMLLTTKATPWPRSS